MTALDVAAAGAGPPDSGALHTFCRRINGLALATAASRVDVPSRGVDRSESTLIGMGKVTGGVFRVYSKAM